MNSRLNYDYNVFIFRDVLNDHSEAKYFKRILNQLKLSVDLPDILYFRNYVPESP